MRGEYLASCAHVHPRLIVPNGLPSSRYFALPAQLLRLILVDLTDRRFKSAGNAPKVRGSKPAHAKVYSRPHAIRQNTFQATCQTIRQSACQKIYQGSFVVLGSSLCWGGKDAENSTQSRRFLPPFQWYRDLYGYFVRDKAMQRGWRPHGNDCLLFQ